jgi:acetyl esterase/lipase
VQKKLWVCHVHRLASAIALLFLAAGCGQDAGVKVPAKSGAAKVAGSSASKKRSLAEARRGFTTKLRAEQPAPEAIPAPPSEVFRLVRFPSAVGELGAYLTPDPGDGPKHPAMIWITGGDCNSIGEVWRPAPRENDQTAAAYRNAGVVLMFPSLRGGNDNPGKHEGFLGEVDDVVAAFKYLAAQPYVDPGRIYLGGHSTGGTLVMLVAEMSDLFRAVFAFGPAADVDGYGGRFVYHQPGNRQESIVRSPIYWLDSVRGPLFVIEGTGGNIQSFRAMQAKSTNPLVRFVAVNGRDHFSVLAPANEAIAAEILSDTGPTLAISLSEQKLNGTAR